MLINVKVPTEQEFFIMRIKKVTVYNLEASSISARIPTPTGRARFSLLGMLSFCAVTLQKDPAGSGIIGSEGIHLCLRVQNRP